MVAVAEQGRLIYLLLALELLVKVFRVGLIILVDGIQAVVVAVLVVLVTTPHLLLLLALVA